jgi:hypothetical protein
MNFADVEPIADAVLFEGYMLYPYRSSAMKNRQRWNFGTLYPRGYAEAQIPPERFGFCSQILIEAGRGAKLSACIRFLQLVSTGDESQVWAPGFVRSRTLENLEIADLASGMTHVFDLAEVSMDECSKCPEGLEGKDRRAVLRLKSTALGGGLYRMDMSLSNESAVTDSRVFTSRTIQDLNFVSAHLLVGVEGASFLSLLEPPAWAEAYSAACEQDGVFPVLVGHEGDRSRILCSPIILYDYPRVAPESSGDFFDGTEMDEMLALRVLTLTDEEKEEIRGGDRYARAVLERTEMLPAEQFARIHGAIRGLREVTETGTDPSSGEPIDLVSIPFDPFAAVPALESVTIFGREVRVGERVRLWPQKRADIMDMAMEGKIAVIEAIEQDLEDQVQLAVVLEDDPGRDMGMLRQAGHRFFFSPEEIEPLGLEAQ